MPAKLVQVTIPAHHEEQTVSVLHDDSRIKGLVFLQAGEETSVMQFRVEDKDVTRVLSRLQGQGVGVRYGYCDVMQLVGGTAVGPSDFMNLEDDSLTLTPAEIYKNIATGAAITRDAFILLCISATVSGIGLATNSQVYVVASMLMSPLMGPLVAASFGLATFSRGLFINGWRNVVIMLAATALIGFVQGVVFCPFAESFLWPTSQMTSRGVNVELLFGMLVAMAGGAAMAVSEINRNVPSIVGIGIAASLLPPAVNCGLCLGAITLGPLVVPNITFSEDVYMEIVWGSCLLVMVNVFLIYATAFSVFKMITPLQQFRFQQQESDDLGLALGASLFERTMWRAKNAGSSRADAPHQGRTDATGQSREPSPAGRKGGHTRFQSFG